MSNVGRNPKLGVLGSANIDLMIRCTELPRRGETILGGDVARLAGGKGANQAVAAARLGGDVALMAALGTDEAGDWLLSEVGRHGVQLHLVQRSARATGTAFIVIDSHGENEIIVAPGANGDLDLASLDLNGFDVVLAQMEINQSVIDEAAMRSRCFILNAAPASSVNAETLEHCAVVIANEVEAASLDVDAIEHCVLTLGARGAVHYQRGREVARAKAPIVEPVDSVGAGDVFCAAYALQYARGATAFDALRFAVTAGALATLACGAQGALPTEGEVEEWLARA